MGIININDDSFSGDGTLDIGEALENAARMVADGADIIDVGAESARTNRSAITVRNEIDRLLPFVHRFSETHPVKPTDPHQLHPPLLSVNTWRPEVSAAVLPHGGDILNDIGALADDRNARVCAAHGVALLIMHSVGEPKIAHTSQRYPDVLAAMEDFFEKKIALAKAAGLDNGTIILDPGIDFAKQRDDNLHIFQHLGRLHRFGLPLLLPVSRKTVIGDVLKIGDPAGRDAGTIACLVSGITRGAHIFRVHNVAAATQSLKAISAVENSGL